MGKSSKNALRALVELQSKGNKELIYNKGTENELKVVVKSAIPHTDRAIMVAEIVAMNFANGGDNINDYMPSSLEFAKRYAVLTHYTDLKLPSNIDELWLVLNHTSIYDEVVEYVGDDIERIFDEANKVIAAKVSYLANKTDLSLFLGNISKIVEQFGSVLGSIDMTDFMKNMKDLPNGAQDLVSKFLAKAQE